MGKHLQIAPAGGLPQLDALFHHLLDRLQISREELAGRSRKLKLVAARQLYCYLAMSQDGHTLAEIGYLIARTHSTVHYSRQTAENRLKTDRYYKHMYQQLNISHTHEN
jgi:chromosomal replication initiation ATPase DnaA